MIRAPVGARCWPGPAASNLEAAGRAAGLHHPRREDSRTPHGSAGQGTGGRRPPRRCPQPPDAPGPTRRATGVEHDAIGSVKQRNARKSGSARAAAANLGAGECADPQVTHARRRPVSTRSRRSRASVKRRPRPAASGLTSLAVHVHGLAATTCADLPDLNSRSRRRAPAWCASITIHIGIARRHPPWLWRAGDFSPHAEPGPVAHRRKIASLAAPAAHRKLPH